MLRIFELKTGSYTSNPWKSNVPLFALCPIVELGFIRIASGGLKVAENVSMARSDLRRIKAALQPAFLLDDLDGNQLPDWVTLPKHTTDGHLLELAIRNKMEFATLDGGIPGALLIPKHIESTAVVREPTPIYRRALTSPPATII